jgi:nucleotide-binding universal stress UspA family protein
MSDEAAPSQLRVLVGVDLTDRSRNAFSRAVEMARSPGAALTLLHVTSDALPHQVATAHDTFATDVLRDLVSKAQAEGVANVVQVLLRGRDYETIIEQARKDNTSLIVIGTHRPSSIFQDMLGTTADRVLRYGAFPLLLVRTKAERTYNTILVAVDFSSASYTALELVIRLFPQARIVALTAYGSPRRSILSDDRQAREVVAETRRLALKGFLAEVAQSLGSAYDPNVTMIVPVAERGWAEDVILKYAEEHKPDLIVVGTHARGGLQHAVLGSVAEWVLTEAPSDVLAVPPAA